MENQKRIPQTYKVNNLALVKKPKIHQVRPKAYNGPWTITEVRNNGTVTQKTAISDIYNIQNITPYTIRA